MLHHGAAMKQCIRVSMLLSICSGRPSCVLSRDVGVKVGEHISGRCYSRHERNGADKFCCCASRLSSRDSIGSRSADGHRDVQEF